MHDMNSNDKYKLESRELLAAICNSLPSNIRSYDTLTTFR